MSILIKTVRIAGFRGLEDIEVELDQVTVLTGMNNTGKTSFLKALQVVFGNRQFISQDDFFIQENRGSKTIVIDICIVPIGEAGNQVDDFSNEWEQVLTTDRIRSNGEQSVVPLRTVITFDAVSTSFNTQQFILPIWGAYLTDNNPWFTRDNGKKTTFYFEEIPFFYMDAQRDILEDTKLRNSYLGKMLSKIEYSDELTQEIEEKIKRLNEEAVKESNILLGIKTALKGLDSTMDTHSEGIEITPFTKKIRDLSKGLTIYYGDVKDSFSMEYHGMGTRSWASLLTLKAFISLLKNTAPSTKTLSPILAVEEPESHLHPNAQKKLYRQISDIPGQKIISTHSPYIAATAELSQIRNFYKSGKVSCGKIDTATMSSEDIRKITRQVTNSRGEMFFSKAIVFFEGETEEQALPIFARKYFGKHAIEIGVDFVGVGGHKGYLPFLRFAESLNIPWLIFSDAEDATVQSVNKQIIACNPDKIDRVLFVDTGNDFERQLISDGYQNEIKQAILDCDEYTNDQHRAEGEPAKIAKINALADDALYLEITKNGSKTKYASAIANQIILSEKPLPPKISRLFGKIDSFLNIKEKELLA